MTDKHLDTPIGSPGKIRTYSGHLVDPFNLQPDDVSIVDIAHALSQLCRFTGHTRRFYSVADHCLLVASLLPTPVLRLAGLVHDASEAYFGDMAGPLKRRPDMRSYSDAEHVASAMITWKFCGRLTDIERKQVKSADAAAYHIERPVLMRPGPYEPYEAEHSIIGMRSPERVCEEYFNSFDHYTFQIQKG
jgi:hypothetical protein